MLLNALKVGTAGDIWDVFSLRSKSVITFPHMWVRRALRSSPQSTSLAGNIFSQHFSLGSYKALILSSLWPANQWDVNRIRAESAMHDGAALIGALPRSLCSALRRTHFWCHVLRNESCSWWFWNNTECGRHSVWIFLALAFYTLNWVLNI